MAQCAPIYLCIMKQLITGLALVALATSASAAPPVNKISVYDMLHIAEDTCPQNPTVAQLRGAATLAGVTQRESDELIALCAMYHFGKSDGTIAIYDQGDMRAGKRVQLPSGKIVKLP